VPGAQALTLATEEDSPVAGKMIRLSGRFRSAVVGHVAPDGSERIECVTTDGTRPPRDGP
jgi:hypothetical protein